MRHALILALLCATCATGAAPTALQLLHTGDIGVLLLVEGRIGERPLRWLIDSGSSHNLVAPSVPASDSVPARQVSVASAAGRLMGTQVDLGTLHLGAQALTGQTALRVDLAPVLGPLASRVDGVLGLPFLDGRSITVDLARRQVDFDAAPVAQDQGVAIERVQQLPVLAVTLQGQPLRLLFDTGAAGGVVRVQRNTLWPRAEAWLAAQVSVAGMVRAQVPVADLSTGLLARALPGDIAGALGMAVLDGCRFTLDLARNRLAVLGCETDALRGGFGVQWAARDGRLVLAHVWPDSPAAKAGLRSNERVLRIDGQPAPAEVPEAEALLARATSLVLEVERNGQAVPVTLQRAYFLAPLPAR